MGFQTALAMQKKCKNFRKIWCGKNYSVFYLSNTCMGGYLLLVKEHPQHVFGVLNSCSVSSVHGSGTLSGSGG